MFEVDPGERAVRIFDPIERVAYRCRLDDTPTIEDASVDRFAVPLDDAFAIEVGRMTFPSRVHAFVHEDGSIVRNAQVGEDVDLPQGSYEVEIGGTPMKLYLAVSGTRVAIRHDEAGTRIEFGPEGREVRVAIGLRSRHEEPAGTITTTDDPRDLMRAVSALASSLKTTSPERSFPTLRGHPPLVEVGERFAIPEPIDPPETGIEIEVPPDPGAIYTASTLAFYLGAELVPTSGEARLVAAGETRALGTIRPAGPDGVTDLYRETREVLEHVFALDCVVRTEGLYDVNLAERATVEDRLADAGHDVDLAGLYERPIDERTARYLALPTAVTDDLLDWYLVADVEARPDRVGMLPHLANRLAHVRSPPASRTAPAASEEREVVSDFLRDESAGFYRDADPASTNASRGSEGAFAEPAARDHQGATVLTPPPVEAIGHVWCAGGYPIGSAKPTGGAYRRALDREPTDDVIDVRIVCNDPAMIEETEDLYGFQDYLTFDIDLHTELAVEEFRSVVRKPTDFLHYVGHVSEEGVECTDGHLDLREVEETGVEAFVLNGCRSYEQGMELVRAGAVGGVVTLAPVANATATEAGRTIARFLDAGFDLFGALHVLTEVLEVGGQYTIVGNGGVLLSQRGGCPRIIHVKSAEESNQVVIRSIAYPTDRYEIGGVSMPLPDDRMRISIGESRWKRENMKKITNILENKREPFILDDNLYWSETLSVEALSNIIDS